MSSQNPVLTVYYDGDCIVCSREIDMYRGWNQDQRVLFVNIMAPTFDAASEGLDPEEVHKVFHVRHQDGRLVKGVEGFVAIWEALERWKLGTYLARTFIGRSVLQLGYVVFCRIRPLLPRRKSCESNYCS